MFHALLESVGLLLLAPGLQHGVMLPHQHRAMSLTWGDAVSAQQAIVTLGAEFKTVVGFTRGLLDQATALGAGFSGRAKGGALLHCNAKIRRRESALLRRAGQSRADDLPALGLGLGQPLGGHIRAIYILHRRLFPPSLRLLLFHLRRSGVVALVSRMRHDAHDEIARRFPGRQPRFAD